MSEAEVLKAVAEWLQEHQDISPERVKMDASIAEDLHLDSLDNVEVVMAIEEMFHVEVDDLIAGKWKTVGDIVHYLLLHPVAADP